MTQVLPPCDGVVYYCGQLSMIRYVYLGSYDDKKKTFFKIGKIYQYLPQIAQKCHLEFVYNLSYQKKQDFWHYKMDSLKLDVLT